MLFDPETFIRLANRSGFTMVRKGDRLIVRPGDQLTDVWTEAFKRHKPGLIDRVPVESEDIDEGQ